MMSLLYFFTVSMFCGICNAMVAKRFTQEQGEDTVISSLYLLISVSSSLVLQITHGVKKRGSYQACLGMWSGADVQRSENAADFLRR